MNRTILALLFTIALTATAQACGWNKFNASAEAVAEAKNNPVLAPVSESNRDIPATPLNYATSTIMSWTHKIKTLLDARVIQENCLTTAVYFEARSESELGQLAVATVILNRVMASKSSSSICGVVYKGASHLNACQFSFACDGKADLVDDVHAWQTARAVAALALTDDKDGPMHILATATNYHADYVDPVWSKSLTRLTKIGRHIFYSQG
ncbi:MAG TPA: cell wall hydrolase [Aestuariivirga sp.]|nr:cell wall hydrolase [Aestuariivirga sp.]